MQLRWTASVQLSFTITSDAGEGGFAFAGDLVLALVYALTAALWGAALGYVGVSDTKRVYC